MAERRMFAKTIIDSDAFLDMPLSAQSLYFHLSMRADDDGFINNPKKIQRMIGAADDDLKLLAAKRFIIPFETGVCVIKHWLIHNYIRPDRYKPTVYQDERNSLFKKENSAYSLNPPINQDYLPDAGMSDGMTVGIPSDGQVVDNLDTQVRLGKDRLGKVRLGEDRIEEKPDDERPGTPATVPIPYEAIKSLYNSICISLPRCAVLSDARKKAIKARFSSGYKMTDFETMFTKAEASGFLKGRNDRNWTANFDWLIKDANMAKVLSGNYDDHQYQQNYGQTPQRGGYQNGNVFLDMLNERRGNGDV